MPIFIFQVNGVYLYLLKYECYTLYGVHLIQTKKERGYLVIKNTQNI